MEQKRQEQCKAKKGMRTFRRRRTQEQRESDKKLNREAKFLNRMLKRMGCQFDGSKGIDKLQFAFDSHMKSLQWYFCSQCKIKVLWHKHERKPVHKCYLFRSSNCMDPGVVPEELCNLTYIEKQLIARIHPVISLYRVKGNQMKYSGNIINFTQDVQEVADVLPLRVSEINSILTFKLKTSSGYKDFNVRREKVFQALVWLKKHNELYHDIVISEKNLDSLPVDGNVFSDLKGLDTHKNDHVKVVVEKHFKSCKSHNKQPFGNLETSNSSSTTSDDSDTESECVTFTDVPFQKNFTQEEKITNNFGEQVLLWPSIGTEPINEFSSPGYISLAFPHLFPFAQGDYSMPRPHKVNLSDYIHHLMSFHDGRFAKDERFRYFMMNTLMRWNCLNAGAMYVRKNPFFSKISVLQLKEHLLKRPSLVRNIMFYNSRVRTTRPYWNARCGELLEMVNQLGPPTVFFTLSSADFHWPDVYRLLGRNVQDLSPYEKMIIISENPLLFDTFFYHRSKFFVENIFKKHFKVKDFWYRYEYQHRGSIHCHGVAWFEDAPSVDVICNADDVTNLKNYFDDIICCENPNSTFLLDNIHPCTKRVTEIDDMEEDLIQLVNRVQRHSECSAKSCLRHRKGESGLSCRFNFPFDLQEDTEIKYENCGVTDIIYKRNDPLVNRYNAWLLQTWRANIDISGIYNSTSVYRYVAKYASKCEIRSSQYCEMLQSVLDRTSDDNVHCKKLIRRLLISSCSERDYCAQEVMHFLMSYNFYKSSREFVVLNLNQIEWDQVYHKPLNNFMEYYNCRPPFLGDKSLYFVAQNYKVMKGEFIRRSKKAIVRVFPRVSKKDDDNNDYHYSVMIKCHIPWGLDIDDRICEEDERRIIDELFHESNILKRNFYDTSSDEDSLHVSSDDERNSGISVLSKHRSNNDEKSIANIGKRDVDKSFQWDDWKSKYNEAELFQASKKINDKIDVKFNFDCDAQNLNMEQKLVLKDLKVTVSCLMRGDKVSNRLCIVQGCAGSGKSYLLGCMVKYICDTLGDGHVRIVGPTGVSAKHVHGVTIQSYLKIGRSFLKFSPLLGDELKTFQLANESVIFLFIDEYSMIGLRLLAAMEQRCREMKDSEELFGNLVVYLFGDVSQLLCVGDTALYRCSLSNLKSPLIERGSIVIHSFHKAYILREAHRFEDDNYVHFLHRLSLGLCTKEDWLMLKKRSLSLLTKSEQNKFKNCVRVCATNDGAAEHNEAKLTDLNKPIAMIKAQNNSKTAMMCSDDVADGLCNILYLCVGAKVMLRRNLNLTRGLVNSSLGNVLDILYDDNKAPPSLPKFILVRFDEVNLTDLEYPFVVLRPCLATWHQNGHMCSRLQYPLSLAWACTIHKTQGLTLKRMLLDMDSGEYQLGLTYVALSRVSKSKRIALLKCLSLDRLNSCRQSMLFYERLRFLKWLQNLA
ncbi:ATP-dependent DNA helicase [Frankliniella fusca]|uniref:ATP-dependent DNA helicase n=1 Tax=Frankliniella fusca TaxID=407009 RepID=A0AAE1HB71_9NEOP|nr:ATP-dependent DNA helicase [Frankliniella fusca]